MVNSALLDASGKLVSVLSLVLDTTERKRAEERATSLQEITASLSRAHPRGSGRCDRPAGDAGAGGGLGFVAALSENGREIEMVRSTHYPLEALASSWPIPVDEPTPLAEAVREGRRVTVESEEEWYARYPAWAEHNRVQGYTAGVAAPLVVDSRVLGVIIVRFVGPRQFREEELRLMEAIAGQASQALECARLFEMERPAIEAKGHVLSVSLPQGSERMDDKIVVEADPARLAQVVANLLDNAAKYTPSGGKIGVSAEAAPLEAQAVVRVRDNGMGIPADLLPRIFDLFAQGERSRQAGFDHHLIKPVDFKDLKRLLASLG